MASFKLRKIFHAAVAAIKGEQASITSGSIDRAIVMLSVPMILEMMMESLFAVVDAFFVSRVSVNAVAVVGITESLLTIIYSVAWGLAMGATALVARRTGEQNIKAAAQTAVQALYIGLFVSLLISIVGLFFSRTLLELMGASPQVIEEGNSYAKIMLCGNIVIMLLFLINGVFRGAGDASLAMRSLWIANIINIILDPLLIFGVGPFPEMGVTGAAVATTTGRGIGVLYQLWHLFKGKGIIKIHWENLKVKWDIIKNIINVSAGGTGQFIIASASWIFLMRIMAHFGSEAVAGYTIAIRIIVFTILPAWGMANAAATMVGQNLGAMLPDRAEKAVWRTGFFNMIFMGLVMICFLFFARDLAGIFTTNIKVLDYASECLSIVSLGYIFYAYGMIIAQSFNGAGDTRTPTILNFFAFWMFQIPLAYLLALKLDFGTTGVNLAIVIAESLLTVAGIILFKRGKWKTVKV